MRSQQRTDRSLAIVRECPPDRRTCAQRDCRHYLPRLPRARAGLAQLHPCSLVVAADGERTLDEVAELLGGLSRQHVHQIEVRAVVKLLDAAARLDGRPIGKRTEAELRRAYLLRSLPAAIRPSTNGAA